MHVGPDDVEHSFVRVEWRRTAPLDYHPTISAPLALIAKDDKLLHLYLASKVVPHSCWGVPDPRIASQLVMMTEKKWHLLRHLGFNPIPRSSSVLISGYS